MLPAQALSGRGEWQSPRVAAEHAHAEEGSENRPASPPADVERSSGGALPAAPPPARVGVEAFASPVPDSPRVQLPATGAGTDGVTAAAAETAGAAAAAAPAGRSVSFLRQRSVRGEASLP